MATGEPRYGVDPYLEWVNREGVPVVEDIGIDLFEVPVKPWDRFGCDVPQFICGAEVISRVCSSLRLPRVDPPRSSNICSRRLSMSSKGTDPLKSNWQTDQNTYSNGALAAYSRFLSTRSIVTLMGAAPIGL